MSELDEDSDGFLQPHEMEAYIRGLIPNLAQLRDMPAAFVQMYCRIAAQNLSYKDCSFAPNLCSTNSLNLHVTESVARNFEVASPEQMVTRYSITQLKFVLWQIYDTFLF
ncbi:putative serine/threonine-protein phosphatase 2A regulatory subunit B'' subunit TON2 [Dendrobium catenatum]|uniref:Putative serine/threonine-protein phosphatase 2A regulatory subunit B'' subunit TON2 n=1 Tax=Dendrobium catenatum TaxID=906689 RepID=A0A2I0WQY4_9ASPA|nr:putative serine/threonine-protein phosphatase 2A regulatory subunit B'' subunit TON2 [Dendrobium catenatum]